MYYGKSYRLPIHYFALYCTFLHIESHKSIDTYSFQEVTIMPFENNKNTPSNMTYSAISFGNPESKIQKSKLSISYFNKVMQISIATALSNGATDSKFTQYDYKNAPRVYISFARAKILHDLIVEKLLGDDTVHNVCVETNQGLLKITDGKEFNCESPTISILQADNSSHIRETVYQFNEYYTGAYNYKSNGSFSTMKFPNIELDTLVMTLEEYYRASSYAIAATVMEASMYKRDNQYNLIKSIAEKMGIQSSNGGFQNKTSFLSGDGNGDAYDNNADGYGTTINSGMIPKEYETSTFDDIAKGLE